MYNILLTCDSTVSRAITYTNSDSYRIRTRAITTHCFYLTRKCTALNKCASYVDQIRMITCLAIILNYSYLQHCFFLFCIPTDKVKHLSLILAFSLMCFVLFHSVCVRNTTVHCVSQGYSTSMKCAFRHGQGYSYIHA